jgi:hypothetical protein
MVSTALAEGCAVSLGDPATVAAVPLRSAGDAPGVIVIGRAAGLCELQLGLGATFAAHVAGALPRASLAA